MNTAVELILGGARSGKSRLAEARALESGLRCVYIATATAGDGEMEERIRQHQRRRDAQWRLVEEPLRLAQVITDNQADDCCLLVDCLTLWLSNCLHAQTWTAERDSLLDVLQSARGRIILVSNETGLGVVPLGELSRQFVDEAGFLHQEIAGLSARVTFTVAGLPLEIKPAVGTAP